MKTVKELPRTKSIEGEPGRRERKGKGKKRKRERKKREKAIRNWGKTYWLAVEFKDFLEEVTFKPTLHGKRN